MRFYSLYRYAGRERALCGDCPDVAGELDFSPNRSAFDGKRRSYSADRSILLSLLRSICLFLAASLPLATQTWGQETPPKDLPSILDGAIEPDAFYFFDEQGNRVMFPGISLEEIDRMKKSDIGYIQRVKPYTINSVTIEGTADDQSAELSVVTKISIAGSPGRWIEIPLKMEGFHQRGPADVVGVENYKVDTAENGGVLLWVKTDQPREIELRMRRVVCRVLPDVGRGIRFRLPPAPTTVSLNVRGDDLSASVVGGGDEVVRASAGTTGETNVDVECSGGTFLLTWRARDGRRESDQILEVDSRTRVVWTDPQSPISVVSELEVSNRRGGSLGPFQVVIPASADLIEPLQNSAGAQLSARDPKSGSIQVTPDDSASLSRLKLTFEYRLQSGNYLSEAPLLLSPIEVPTAVRQSGEIEIRTDRNFRLRWKQQSNVRSIWRTSTNDPVDIRVYSFQFDRAAFELPIWLTAKQQRLRVEPEYVVKVGKQTATLEARITATGTIIEGVPLVVNAAGWQTVAVEDLETGRGVDDPLGDSGEGLELELGELTPSGTSSVGVLWKAIRPIAKDDNAEATLKNNSPSTAVETAESKVRFELPTISLPDDRAVIVSQGTLIIGPATGFSLIPDLEASQGLNLLPNESSSSSASRPISSSVRDLSEGASRFRVVSVGASPTYQGYLSERTPEIDIDAKVDLTLDGEVIRVINDWLIKPTGRLQGQLPIIIPTDPVNAQDSSRMTLKAETDASIEAKEAELRSNTDPPLYAGQNGDEWLVKVDGQPAFLRNDGGGRWTLFSERLAGEPCRVQLETVRTFSLQANKAEDAKTSLDDEQVVNASPREANTIFFSLPRPNLAGTTIGRTAPVSVSAPSDLRVLLGEERVQPSLTQPYDAFANSTLIVNVERMKQTETTVQVVPQALMRTELGRARRYDRLLARVSGGNEDFRVEFINSKDQVNFIGTDERIIRVWVNGTEVTNFQRSQTGLTIPLSREIETAQDSRVGQLVDIQIWRPRKNLGVAGMISPDLLLPLSSGKTYWDVVMSNDRHLVWCSPGSSELMVWRYENLFVRRTPLRTYTELLTWIGGPQPTESQAGNRYLMVTSDPRSLRICEAGRPLLWFSIGGLVLGVSTLLFYFPILRHPLLAVLGGVSVGGLAWLAPDLAVIAGQLMIAAMLLVVLMMGIRSLLSRRPRATVLGGVPESSSVRSLGVRRSGVGSAVGSEVAASRPAETIGSGSAAGVQS